MSESHPEIQPSDASDGVVINEALDVAVPTHSSVLRLETLASYADGTYSREQWELLAAADAQPAPTPDKADEPVDGT